MNVKIIKLLNGEELISEVAETLQETDYIILKNPAVVRTQQVAPNQFQIGLGPFLAIAEEVKNDRTIELKKSAVIATAPPKKDILNEYNKIFGSNIIIPDTAAIPQNVKLHV